MITATLAAAQQATSPPQPAQLLQDSAFFVSESRHGRPRKLTKKVQEMFEKTLQRQRNHRKPVIAQRKRRNDEPSDDEEDEGDSTRKWCFCNDTSHGEMIRCDNSNCTLRWFHFPCLGIVEKPRGKWWYCPRCDVTQRLRMAENGDDFDTPTCFCNELNHGQMIKCDNSNCTHRWFHFPCVGIVEPPEGEWYCSQCDVTGERNA
ncbi:hypothetical protein CAEBREN_21364 [Caenorhabditis brenneri]|uniref:PHD-type domain-containing protein n=1 Tax=Caenorhabditis brenneri TaxID=135651 RepID=G0MQ89_CAEBE|nr:hypothetical protein CAEBREN_21364 [Caenorhabditis brenneri]